MGLPFPSPFLDPQGNFSAGINFASGGSGLLDSTGQNLVSSLPVFNIAFIESDFLF
jgi:hypothetical protein